MGSQDEEWWRQAIVYQIYPRSFADNNGDGIGDFKGITSRVGYLHKLGVDAVWLSPFYPSALKDGGYDVDDYRDVDPRIGTLDDFDELVTELKKVGIRTIVDIVPNHSSVDHEWFKAALKAGKGSAERDRYIFRDGTGPKHENPPTDWESTFGGPAWSPSGCNDGQWYYHWFDSSQPDWNWHNEDVKADFIKTLRFWGDRGVSGFRIDVAHGLAKDMTGDLPGRAELAEMTKRKLTNGNGDLQHPILDRDEVQDIYRSWRKIFDEYSPPLMAVAECWVAPDRKHLYAAADGLGQAFSFDIVLDTFSAPAYRKTIEAQLRSVSSSNSSSTWVLSNHDVIRHASRYALPTPELDSFDLHEHQAFYNRHLQNRFSDAECDSARGLRQARAASIMLLGLPGSTYLYQGEELGLPEVVEISEGERQDPSFFRTKGRENVVGRDGCRVPLPWTSGGQSFGYSTKGKSHLPMPSWWGEFSVERQQAVTNSTLVLYQTALNLRKRLRCSETLEWVDHGDPSSSPILHFRRPNGWEVILNAGESPVRLPKGQIVLSSCEEPIDSSIPAYTTVWLLPGPS